MNRARFVAALIAAVGVTITVSWRGLRAVAVPEYSPSPGTRTRRWPCSPRPAPLPFPQSAIGNPGPMHYVGVFEHDTRQYLPAGDALHLGGRPQAQPHRLLQRLGRRHSGPALLPRPPGPEPSCWCTWSPGTSPWPPSAAGHSDRYLRRFAAAVRHYGGHVIISFAPEADGRWYPWGWRHADPARWVAAWRHVVTVFRQAGAINVTWLWVMSGDNRVIGHLRDWWPGARYVDWIGVDGYYFTRASTFKTVIGNTVRSIRKFTHKPVLISEVGIGPRAGQAAKLPGLFTGIRRNHLLGLVYFDVEQHQGLYHQDWRLDDNPAAVAAFRAGVRAAQLSPAKRRGG